MEIKGRQDPKLLLRVLSPTHYIGPYTPGHLG